MAPSTSKGAATAAPGIRWGLLGGIRTSVKGFAARPGLSSAAAALGIVNGPGMMGFGDGNSEGWSVSTMGYSDALGEFMGPFAGSDAPVTNQVVLPDDATEATISFDLLLLGSRDGDSPVWSDAASGGRGDGIAFTVEGGDYGFGNSNDARWTVNLAAENPPQGGFELGVNGTSNQGPSDESFGIDNYLVRATTG